MMGLHFMDEVPFHHVYLHALVRDEKGAKMSKSKGNVMDPLDIIDGVDLKTLIHKRTSSLANPKDAKNIEAATRRDYPQGIATYGADALRFTLAAMAAQGRDIKMSIPRVEGYRNFGTKLWNAARFAEMNGALLHHDTFKPRECREVLNLWSFGELARTRNEITEAIEACRFNDAANAAYRFVWNVFCDWYVELAKPVLQGPDSAAKDETRGAVAFLLYEIAKLLHPFMPFITEEIWAAVNAGVAGGRGLLALAHWPRLEGLANPAAEAEVGWVVDLVSEIRSVRAEMSVPGAALIPLVLVGAAPEVAERAQRWRDTLLRLARLSDISAAAAAPKGSAQMIIRGTVMVLPLEGIIDLAAEEIRLEKEIARLQGECAKAQAKLGNADFVARAPEEVIEENRERLGDALAQIGKLKAALARLRE